MINGRSICIVDYGVGNLFSALKAFKQFSPDIKISEDATDITKAGALVLPGVGAFEAGMHGLNIRGLVEAVKDFAASGKPIIGICLGAQLLFTKGYEFGEHQGLNIISGEVVPFPKLTDNAKIPHIGWNELIEPKLNRWNNSILSGVVEKKNDVYFVHSFIFKPENEENCLAKTEYGGLEFCSVVQKNNIYGCQFHPEKSGQVGLQIIKNFVDLIK